MSYMLRRYPKKFRGFRKPMRRSYSETDIQEEIEKMTKPTQEMIKTQEMEMQKPQESGGPQEAGELRELRESRELQEPSKTEFFEEGSLEGPEELEPEEMILQEELEQPMSYAMEEFQSKPKTEKPMSSKKIIKEEEIFETPEGPEKPMSRTSTSSSRVVQETLSPEKVAEQPEQEIVRRQQMLYTIEEEIQKITLIIRAFFLLFIFLLVLVLFLFTESLKERDFVYIGTFFIDFVKLFPALLFMTITFVLTAAYLQLSDYITASVILVIFSIVFITLSIVYLLIIITGLPFDVLKYITVVVLFVADIMGIIVAITQFLLSKKKKLFTIQKIQESRASTETQAFT